MFVQSLLGAFSKLVLANRLIRGVAALILGGATLWWIAEQAGPVQGTVLVHVTESDVEVTAGGHTVSIAEWRFTPIEYVLLELHRGPRRTVEGPGPPPAVRRPRSATLGRHGVSPGARPPDARPDSLVEWVVQMARER